eukprot:scaffold1258_cov190-Pinguiococcus_pyrenoidosus.AAC.3
MTPVRLSVSLSHRYGGDLRTPSASPWWRSKGPFELAPATPGPASYRVDSLSSLGRQLSSQRISEAHVTFGAAKRQASDTPPPRSPGPKYRPEVDATRPRSPSARFGGLSLDDTLSAPAAHGAPDRPESRGVPGPGAYVGARRVLPAGYLNPGASRGTFGRQAKAAFQRQYPGKSMDKLGARAASPPSAALAPPSSSLGLQSTRPTSPAFSFGPTPRRRRAASVSRRVATRAVRLNARRPRTTRSGARARQNYDWLYVGQDVRAAHPGSPGARRAGSSFSRSARFENKAWDPLRVTGASLETPGPKYDTRGAIGSGAPQISFPRVAGREDLLSRYLRRQKRPGPADYALCLEHSLERYLAELHAEQRKGLRLFATESEVQSFLTRSTDKSAKSRLSLNSSSSFAIAAELGVFQAGYPPTRPKSPAWKFPRLGRNARPSFVSEDFSRDRKGRESPGPATAHPALFSPNVSRPNSPAFSFGRRTELAEKPSNNAGPAAYGWHLEEALGKQRLSTKPSSPAHSFAAAKK